MTSEDITYICELEWWTIVMLIISLLGVTGFFISIDKTLGICKRYLYSNAFHLILLLSDIYSYAPLPISNIFRDIILFKMIGALSTNLVVLRNIAVGMH